MKPEEIAWRRLAAQFLTTPGPAKPVDVVRRLGVVQAQDYAGAKWALALRTRKPMTDAAVERAVDAGAIVRTHVLRPTWHFVACEDLRWMLALTGPRISRALSSYNRKLEITPAVIRKSHAAIVKALSGGKHLTRSEVRAVLARAKVGTLGGHRFGHLIVQAELDAIVCSGARRGKQSTYALLDERIPVAQGIERDAALAELARRYFPTRGPASAHDFAWWSGLTVGDARRAVAILGRELEAIEVGGRPCWMSANARTPPKPPCAHLLPNYDEYFIGLVDRGAIGRRLNSVERVTGGNALINHIATVNGQIVGGWKRVTAGPRVTLRFELLTRLSRAERRLLDREIERYRAFAGEPVEAVFSERATPS
jgi:winged helix DNA-binding protein